MVARKVGSKGNSVSGSIRRFKSEVRKEESNTKTCLLRESNCSFDSQVPALSLHQGYTNRSNSFVFSVEKEVLTLLPYPRALSRSSDKMK